MNQTKPLKALTFMEGLVDGLPIFVGYFPIAMAFGILSRSVGLSLYETLAFSLILFAGAAQFIGVGMIAAGVGGAEIIIATLFLNFRHFLMSASLATKIKFKHPQLKPLVSFFVTDESFSVASFAKGQLTEHYLLPMQLIGYLGWGLGTGLGFIVGSVLPELLQKAMAIGLYVMFIALLVPEIKKSNRALVLSLMAGFLNTLLRNLLHLPQGWSIVLAIIVTASIGVIIFNNDLSEEAIDYE